MEHIAEFPIPSVHLLSKEPHIEAVRIANMVQIWYDYSGCSLSNELLSAMIGYLTREYNGSLLVNPDNAHNGMIAITASPTLLRDENHPQALENACQLARAALRSSCIYCSDYDKDFAERLKDPFFNLDPA